MATVQLTPLASARADWAPAGLTDLSIRAVVRTPSGMRFAAAGEGLYRSLDGGASWSRFVTDQFGDSFTAITHPDSNLLFVSAEMGTFRSKDDGESWTKSGDDIAGTYSLAVAPNRDLYASGGFGTFRSTDRGLSWVPVEATPGSFTDGLAIDPDGRVFLRSIFGSFLRSTDHGANWVTLNPSTEYPSAHAVSPITGTVLVGTQIFAPGSWEVFRSSDHGDSWQNVKAGVGSMDAVHFLGNGDAVLGAGPGLVLHSTDDGLTWTPRSAGIPPALQIECFPEIQGVVFAGMRFGGLWRDEQFIVSAPQAAPAAARGLRLTATPSLFSTRTSLRFDLPGAAAVALDVFDVQGKRVARVAEGSFAAGPHVIGLEARTLPAGLHFARLSAGAWNAAARLLVLR